MAQTVPTAEPARVTAGDTLTWSIALDDFPAGDGWALKYRLINPAGKIDLTAAALGDAYLVQVPATTSAAWPAGRYAWTRYVQKGAARHTTGAGVIVIDPDLAAQSAGYDTRSSAKKCLDELDAALAAYGHKAYTQEYDVAGRHLRFASPADFLAFRSKVQAEVAREEAAARLAAGDLPRTKILTRFI